ncbi:hypothetical protein M0R88_12880 [Halorussus gelatinilyticus]|uniref:Uncharacterized protein n=1 Tax=Halorussus gelatinilyticus TaxID=2937524 RepID=A0A8U0IFG4_9EURY|nr:hypothetical protein [Halorussus gelatinilyticus]UPV99415.1 hypothetical protein M0R88_12880 [Halorussus gelatinilyticus]
MSSHGARGRSSGTVRLPETVPFTLPALNRLSWELGSRVVSRASKVAAWEHRSTGRTLGVYDVTENTVVLAVRTPVGRERFYGAAKADFEEKRTRLAEADDWRRA